MINTITRCLNIKITAILKNGQCGVFKVLPGLNERAYGSFSSSY